MLRSSQIFRKCFINVRDGVCLIQTNKNANKKNKK